MEPDPEFPHPSGRAVQLDPDLRLIRAPNPSPMTGPGTNTYLLGPHDVVVIDPGPALPGHLAAILAALPANARISHILVTHSHLDHSALARPLAAATGAPVLGFGTCDAGRSAIMARLALAGGVGGGVGGGEGVDPGFTPDVVVADGQRLRLGGTDIEVIHTPGHFGNHLCFASAGRLFSGDHVMGWASSLISPPDGDLTDYMASLARLVLRPDRIYHPGHGAPVLVPAARVKWLIRHRRAREARVLAALGPKPQSLDDLLPEVYADTDPHLWPAAARNLLAHLIDLHQRGLIGVTGSLGPAARYRRP